ncbi:hypothetical protein CES85_1075 [Ochrobactrum quorumnocens]|uniref:Tip attachment protein J domain-containing protein n=1 Tax=Ochrobactrum quorumnocens TaxID=271865 RepID=A0A248UIB7_9HYPH|nr:phage tail protein [[Ochrobactrum] quorumnocens]ASV86408.1 hypothetical protein CES85_1075 [[Ochrobactrum] quorumnocens]
MKYLLAIFFALLASPAAAEPVSLIVGAIGAAGSWLFGGTMLANLVLGGLAVAAQYAYAKLYSEAPKSSASATETKYGENLTREVGLGIFGTNGHHVYRNAFDKGNHIVQDVFKLSDFRCTELLRVQMDGEWKSLSPDQQGDEGRIYGQRVLGVKDSGQLFVRFYHGAFDQTSDSALVAYANPVGRWTTAHRGAGLCYVIVTTITDVDNITAVPGLRFEVRGAPLYDPRKDSSVGGFGSHRWNDQSTWEFSDNPPVIMFNLERGIYIGTEKIVGRGIAASLLPLSEWFTAMNICDEVMSDGSRRYRAALIASSGDGVTHDSNMTPLREACAGSWVESVRGQYPIVGANQAVVATITDQDIAWEKPFQLSLHRTQSELVNTMAATYVSPDLFYETSPLATRIDAVALAQDRERLASKVDYTAVTDPRVGDRLADIAIRASRYQANGSFVVRPKFLGLQVGQWVEWQSVRYKRTIRFQVHTKSLGAMGSDGVRDVSISWKEVGDGIFDPTAYETNPPVPIPNGQPIYQTQLANFNAIPNRVIGDDGQEYPGIRLFWDEIADTTVEGVEIQYWPENDPSQIFTDYVPRDVTVFQIVNGLTRLSEWNVRYRFRVAAGTRPVTWSAPVLVLTQETSTDNSPVDYGRLDDDVTGLLNWMTDDRRELVRQAQENATSSADGLLSAYSNIERLSRRLTSTYGTAKASWQEDILTATGPNSAIGQQLIQINVSLGNKADASTVSLLQSRVDGVEGDMTAISNALTEVNASVDGSVSNAAWRMTATQGAGGQSVKISAFGRVGSGDSWKQAGWFVNVTPTSSQFVVISNQFAIADPNDDGSFTYPFVVEDGRVVVENIVVGTVKFKRLQSDNEKLDMRGDVGNAYLRIIV